MHPEKEYQIALELASTLRYEEAKKKLERILEEQPGNIDALLLLGKVGYYLRRYSSSRAIFETALLYDPENTTAYFGLQFFRERIRNIKNAVFLASAIFLLIAAGVVLSLGLDSSFTARLSGLEENRVKTEESLYQKIALLELRLEESAVSRIAAEERNAGQLRDLSKILEDNADSLDVLQRNTQAQIEGLRESMTRLVEFHLLLNHSIEDLLHEIENLRIEAHRFR
jgi:tetratricopeptide (TPR) repeat protein